MRLFLAAALSVAALVSACAPSPEISPPRGLLDVTDQPAEKALLAGLRAYDDAQYAEAEKQLNAALLAGLVSPRDKAAAHKHLAFIYCTSERVDKCEVEFRAARLADPGFGLSKSEAGHPLWGPVYQRVTR